MLNIIPKGPNDQSNVTLPGPPLLRRPNAGVKIRPRLENPWFEEPSFVEIFDCLCSVL